MDPRCNLIIDSCCDLPSELVQVEGVELLKFPYITQNGEFIDDLFTSISAHEFYDMMRKGDQPKTAQIPYPVMEEVFGRAIRSGIPTVYLAFSSALTGNFDTACMIRDNLLKERPHAELYMVDTKLASIAEGLIVFEAIRQRDRGLSARELAEWAQEARYYVRSSFMVDSLEWLSHGGRIPATVAYASAKLDVKPLFFIDELGKLALSSVARGRKKAIRSMADYFATHTSDYPGQRVIIGNADCPRDAERLADSIRKVDGTVPIMMADTGPVIGSHVGPGMLSLVFWGIDMREDLSVADRIAKKIKGA